MLDYLSRDKGLLEKIVGGMVKLEQSSGGECRCGYKSSDTVHLAQHNN